MAIALSQTPSTPFDQVYGANPVTLTGLSTISPLPNKYVLQVLRGGQIIGDVRQAPNSIGRAVFDIQNILQNFVAPSPNNVEVTGYIGTKLISSQNETVEYQIRIGYETSGVVAGLQTYNVKFVGVGGSKPYFEVPYPNAQFIPIVNNAGPCSSVTKQGRPFSDMENYRLASQITDGKPNWLTGAMRVYDHYVTRDDMETLSYWNSPSVTGTPSPATKSIEAITIWQYVGGGNTPLAPNVIYNTISNGGGPNPSPGTGTTVAYPYWAITAGVGPKNINGILSASTTHYYVATNAYTYPNGCVSQIQGLGDGPMHYVHRFNIIEESCNDFPEIQVSWLNSYGFRDYYSFRKRHDRNVTIGRNTYLQEAANYNGTGYNVNIYDRGTTTYSQDLGQEFIAFTDFLSDADALFLEKLFISADVKVRFNDSADEQYQWVPVTLMNKTYTEKTVRKNKLFQYDITFRIAHNIKSQRG